MTTTPAKVGDRSGTSQDRVRDPTRPTPRLLVVDDEPNICELVTMWFHASGWDVTTAGSGPDGLARAIETCPDAVVLDVMLPGFTGLELLRRLRRTSSRAVVVLNTASDDPDWRREGLVAGADAYLTKPYSLLHLEATLHRLLHERDTRPDELSAEDRDDVVA